MTVSSVLVRAAYSETASDNLKLMNLEMNKYFFLTMAQQPYWAKAFSWSRTHDYTHLDTPHSVGLLWTNDQHVAETST